jgi:capsular exopolysaccharide synthesis family protein
LARLIAEIWSERLVFVLVFLALIGVGAAGYSSLTPQFRARALVLVDPGQKHVVEQSSIVSRQPIDAAAVQTAANVLRSPQLLLAVIDRLGLQDDPEFVGRPPTGLSAVVHGLLSRLPRLHPRAPQTPEATALAALEKHVTVAQDGRSYVVAITATSKDPAKAAKIATTLADEYVASQVRRDITQTRIASQAIYSRLAELRDKLRRSQTALNEYKAKNGLLDGVTSGGTVTPVLPMEIGDTETQLMKARSDRAVLEAKLAHVADPAASADVLASPVIQQLHAREADLLAQQGSLATQYGPRHPRTLAIKAQLARLQDEMRRAVAQVRTSLKNDLAVARRNESMLETRLAQLKAKSASQAAIEGKLAQLKQEVQSDSTIYEAFLQRFKATAEHQRLAQPDVEVVAQAVPPTQPFFPRPALMLAGLLFGAGSGASLTALARNRLRRGFRSAIALADALRTPAVAVVPHLAARQRNAQPGAPGVEIESGDARAYAEAIGNVRFLFSRGAAPGVVLFTSAVPKEGKTLLASSVALQAARAGLRTLYIDCDLYKAENTSILGFGKRPGLSESLTTGTDWRDAVLGTGTGAGTPHLLPHGRRCADPTRLISSAALATLVNEARRDYDLVILDGPPLLATSGARFLAALADNVVFVALWGKTRRRLVTAAYAELVAARAPICGSVLMDADMRKLRSAGYVGPGTYYGRYPGYAPRPLPQPAAG